MHRTKAVEQKLITLVRGVGRGKVAKEDFAEKLESNQGLEG